MTMKLSCNICNKRMRKLHFGGRSVIVLLRLIYHQSDTAELSNPVCKNCYSEFRKWMHLFYYKQRMKMK